MFSFIENDYTDQNEHVLTWWEIEDAYGLTVLDSSWPIFDETYRTHLSAAIKDHFYYREIAAKTPQMFRFYLNRRLREVMPTYNAIYKLTLKDATFDPFDTRWSTGNGNNASNTNNNYNGTDDGNSSTKADSNTLATNIVSNTPASFMNDPTEPKYMSQLTQTKGESHSTGSGTTHNEQTHTDVTDYLNNYLNNFRERSGYISDNAISLMASGLLNTDALVFDELEPCFGQFWDDQPL